MNLENLQSTTKIKSTIQALIIKSGGCRFAVPQENLRELVQLGEGQTKSKVEYIQGTPIYRLRGILLPLVSLQEALQIKQNTENNSSKIVVVQADDRRFGLLVDEIIATEEITKQPLWSPLKKILMVAGAAVMADGKMVLILDAMGLAKQKHLFADTQIQGKQINTASSLQATQDVKEPMLLFGVDSNGTMGVPLAKVERLEELKRSLIEHSGTQDVVQYRGNIIPLIHLSKEINGKNPPTEKENLPTLVFTNGGKSVGLVVDRIYDIADEKILVKRSSNRPNILGTAVVQGRVIDMLDVESLINEMDPTFFGQQNSDCINSEGSNDPK